MVWVEGRVLVGVAWAACWLAWLEGLVCQASWLEEEGVLASGSSLSVLEALVEVASLFPSLHPEHQVVSSEVLQEQQVLVLVALEELWVGE